ncbi:hypothetical protein [Acidiphilium sp.]|jgi:hypothetical protein|uniref:hypothetical protein n=1 Tax=Acidiphilium sp. TaxID=527 RepID=UPI002590FBA8|nr:hypothetical protein [Acidiphilium sp.]
MDPMPRTLEDHLRDRRARIASWLEQHTEAETATAVCERWIVDLLARDLTLYSRQDLGSLPADLSLVDRLSAEKLDGLSAALAWQIEDAEGKEPDEAPLIGHVLAAASGHAYAIHGPGKLDWIGHFVASIDGASWEDFADAAAQVLGRNPDVQEAFVDFLATIVTKANDAPDTVTEIPPRRASMASIAEQFARAGSFEEVWEADQWPILFRSSDAFEILRRADADRFVTMIDQLPHPTLVKQCLSSKALLTSPHDALILLRLANTAFDAEGRWQRSGMAAILLLQSASEQLLSPRGDEVETEDLSKGIAQFRNAVGGVLDILFARADGVELAWHWLENLLRQTPRVPPAGRSGPRKQMINRIGILAHALSSRMTPRRAQDAWIRETKPLERQIRAVAVLSVAAFTTTVADLDVGSIAKGLLKGDGFELTRANDLIQLPGAPLRTIPGDVLARLPGAAAWFTSTWSALRFERERAWRANRHSSGNPAEIMGLWGLGAVESLVMNAEAQPGDAAGMWLAVERAFREARLVEPRLGRDFWSQAVARLFWWWPQVFTAIQDHADNSGAGSSVPTALGRALVPYAEISGDFMAVTVTLQQAGLPILVLDEAVHHAGHNLLPMIRLFVATARHLNDRRAWNPDWVAALGRIEAEIAGDRQSADLPARTGRSEI